MSRNVILLIGSYLFFFFWKKGRLPHAAPDWDVSRTLEAWLPNVPLQMDHDTLFGDSSKGAQRLLYSCQKNDLPLWGRPSSPTQHAASGGTHMEWWGQKGTLRSRSDHPQIWQLLLKFIFILNKISGPRNLLIRSNSWLSGERIYTQQ